MKTDDADIKIFEKILDIVKIISYVNFADQIAPMKSNL